MFLAKSAFACSCLGRASLLLMIGIVPWLFAGVQPRVQVWLFGGAAIALVCGIARVVAMRDERHALPGASLVLCFAVGLGLFQLTPLNQALLTTASPQAVALRGELQGPAAAQPRDLGSLASGAPASLYPCSTRRDLALLILAAAVFLAGAILFAGPESQTWLMWILAVNGAALTVFALIQQLQSNGMIYWTFAVSAGSPFGPFVNRNNAGGFLNLCLAGAVGTSVLAILANLEQAGESGWDGVRRSALGDALLRLGQFLDARVLVALTLTGCLVAGVFCSLSRGAVIAMLAAALAASLVAGVAHARRRLPVMLAALVVGVSLIAWIGRGEAVRSRLATLFDPKAMQEHALLPHWQNALLAVPDFGKTGSGLGTYRYLYGLYERQPQQVWFFHAENQYLEALVEAGWFGLGLMISLLLLVAIAARRLMRHGGDPTLYAFGVTGIFAVAAQAVSGGFDFGLHIPANLVTAALLGGAICGPAARLAAVPPCPGFRHSRFLTAGLATLALAAVVWGGLETHRRAAVKAALTQARHAKLLPRDDPATPDQVVQATGSLARAVGICPDDAEAQLGLAQLHTYRYRLALFDRFRVQDQTRDADRLWQDTSPTALHAHVQRMASRKDRLEALRSDPFVQQHLRPAFEHLTAARGACPLLPTVHVGLAELAFLGGDPADDGAHLDRARRLAPGDAVLLLHTGILDFQAGRVERACAVWQQCLETDSRHLERILSLAGNEVSLLDVVERILPASPELLVRLARDRYTREDDRMMRALLIRRARGLLAEMPLAPADQHHLRGLMLAIEKNHVAAAGELARAVELRPDQVVWRYEWAVALLAQGRLDEAREQAKWCGRMAPREDRYRKLLEQIYDAQL